MSEANTLKEAKERFARNESTWSTVRKEALEDIKFARRGEQWPDQVKADRQAEGRPCLTVNKLNAIGKQVTNDARLNKPSIKVLPSDSQADVKTAKIFDGIIRNIEAASEASAAYDTAVEHSVYGGFGFFRIDIDYEGDYSFDMGIRISRIPNQFSVYWDADTQAPDSSDWDDCFITEMVNKERHAREYPGSNPSSWDASGDSGWITEDQIRRAEYWVRTDDEQLIVKLSDGTILSADKYAENKHIFDAKGATVVIERTIKVKRVTQRLMTAGEILKETSWVGRYIPVIPVYGDEVNIEGKRYFHSLIRDAKDPQRMFNYWRTISTETVALAPKAPYIGPEEAFEGVDANKWATANSKNWAFIGYKGPVGPQRQPFPGIAAGALQEALSAADDIKSATGIFDAAMGNRSNETSGIAISQRKRESDVGTYHFIDNLNRSIHCAGVCIVDMIPLVYDQPRIVRILGEDGTPSSVQVNQKHPGPEGIEQIFDLTVGKYDVVVKSGPGFTTRREEAAAQMIEMGRAAPQLWGVAGDLVVKNFDWPGAEELAERLRLANPIVQAQEQKASGQPPPPPPEVQIAMAKAQAETQAAQMKAQVEAQVKQQDAATEIEIARAKAANEITLAQQKASAEIQIAREKAAADAEIKRETAAITALTKPQPQSANV